MNTHTNTSESHNKVHGPVNPSSSSALKLLELVASKEESWGGRGGEERRRSERVVEQSQPSHQLAHSRDQGPFFIIMS